jgi:hypothetical protein
MDFYGKSLPRPNRQATAGQKMLFLSVMALIGFMGVVVMAYAAEANEMKGLESYSVAQWVPNPRPYPPPYYPPPPSSQGPSHQAQPSGWVHVEVFPPDAEVFLDGIKMERGEDKAFEEGVLTGRHKVEVKKDGYHDHMELVDVYPAAKERLKIPLKKIGSQEAPAASGAAEGSAMKKSPSSVGSYEESGQARAWGWVHVEVDPPGAKVFLDGNRMGPGENSGFEERVLPGRHKVEVKKEGYLDRTEFVDVQAAVKERLKISLKKISSKKVSKEPAQGKGGEEKPVATPGPAAIEPFPFK